jgi:hypothetical protein
MANVATGLFACAAPVINAPTSRTSFTFCRASPTRSASAVADAGSASSASNRARIGSSETAATAGSSITATSNKRWSPGQSPTAAAARR